MEFEEFKSRIVTEVTKFVISKRKCGCRTDEYGNNCIASFKRCPTKKD